MSNLRYEMGEQLPQSLPLKLLYISTSIYEGDWYSTLHSHQCTELFYMLGGVGYFLVEEETFAVATGDVIIINSGVQHTETGNPGTPMEYIVLGIQGGDFLVKENDESRYCVLHCSPGNNELLDTIKNILGEMEGRQEHFDTVAHSYLKILTVKLLRSRAVQLQEMSRQKTGHDCANIKRYIDTHFKENITLDTLAEMAHLNKYYLVHTFTKEVGVSPINYLIRRRIEESRYFLVQTDMNISEISQVLGFSSPSYFSQSFSRLEKMSPREYRRRAQERPAAGE